MAPLKVLLFDLSAVDGMGCQSNRGVGSRCGACTRFAARCCWESVRVGAGQRGDRAMGAPPRHGVGVPQQFPLRWVGWGCARPGSAPVRPARGLGASVKARGAGGGTRARL